MIKIRYIKTLMLILVSALVFTTSSVYTEEVTAQPVQTPSLEAVVENAVTDKALDIVNRPNWYLNKTVVINAKFDKFSTLGLDYKPAFRSSEEYISFLIKRDDTTYDIPLSEMKLFIKREEAEKFIDLKTDDEIQITGKVFSNALSDIWIDVTKLVLVKKAPDKDGV